MLDLYSCQKLVTMPRKLDLHVVTLTLNAYALSIISFCVRKGGHVMALILPCRGMHFVRLLLSSSLFLASVHHLSNFLQFQLLFLENVLFQLQIRIQYNKYQISFKFTKIQLKYTKIKHKYVNKYDNISHPHITIFISRRIWVGCRFYSKTVIAKISWLCHGMNILTIEVPQRDHPYVMA